MRFPTAEEKRLYLKAAGRKAPACLLIRFPVFGRFIGFTFGAVIFHETDRPELIVHEMVHVQQFYDGWGLGFWVVYLWYRLTKGYENNPYEIEANEIEGRVKW